MTEDVVNEEVLEEKLGIKEFSEAIRGANVLALFLIKRLKDGAGFDDLMALWDKLKTDEEFKSALLEAGEGYSKIPAEVKDIDLSEGLEIGGMLLKMVPDYVEAFKK